MEAQTARFTDGCETCLQQDLGILYTTSNTQRVRLLDKMHKVGHMDPQKMSMAISDPGHLTDTWNIRWLKIFAPDGLDFVEVDCKLPLPPSQ